MKKIITATLIAVLAVALALPATALSNRRHEMLHRVNAARVDHGLHRLAFDRELSVASRRHCKKMARAEKLYHTADRWIDYEEWGQVVGVGPNVRALFKAYMHSPEHRHILLNGRYRHIGIGFFRDKKGNLWSTMTLYR